MRYKNAAKWSEWDEECWREDVKMLTNVRNKIGRCWGSLYLLEFLFFDYLMGFLTFIIDICG